MRVRSFCIAAAVGLCLAGPSLRAQTDAAKRAKVEELFTVMRLDHTMDQLLDIIRRQSDSMLHSMPGYAQMTPEQKARNQEFQDKVMKLALDSVGWKALEPEMVTLYANTYSEQEIDGMLAFYRSPVGQTMLAKQPELAKDGMQLAQQRMIAMEPKLQELVQEYMKQGGPPVPAGLAPPPPPPPPPNKPAPDTAQPQ